MMYVSHCGSVATSSLSIDWKFFFIAPPNVCSHLVIQVTYGSGGFDLKCASRVILTNLSKNVSNASTMMNNIARPNCVRVNGCRISNDAVGGWICGLPLGNEMVLLNPKRARKQAYAASIHKSQHRNGLCLFCRLVYLYMYNVKAAFGWKCLWFKTWCYTYGGVFFV